MLLWLTGVRSTRIALVAVMVDLKVALLAMAQ
jgi:hypothetical protein